MRGGVDKRERERERELSWKSVEISRQPRRLETDSRFKSYMTDVMSGKFRDVIH